MAVLGIDYGDKKIGFAKSSGSIALPFGIIRNKGFDDLVKNIQKMAQEEDIEEIIIGVPRSMKEDTRRAQEKKILNFIEMLKTRLSIPLHMEDERLSTKMAQHLARGALGREEDDAISAMLILQNYLDRKHNLQT